MSIRRAAGAVLFAGSFALAGPAVAQTYVGVTPPQVGSADASPGVLSQAGSLGAVGGVQSQVGAVSPAAARAGGLAFTGSDVMGLLLIAGSSVVVGTVVVRFARSRPTA